MWKWLSQLLSQSTLEPDESQILLVEDLIIIYRPRCKEPVEVRWDNILEIQTYKVDLLVYDDICLALRTQDWWHELSERDEGFWELTEEMRVRFPSIDPEWYATVMQPAFATNQRILWQTE